MKAVILIDNLTRSALKKEWGLSVYIEHDDRKILLDTGASGVFAENADALGISLENVMQGYYLMRITIMLTEWKNFFPEIQNFPFI